MSRTLLSILADLNNAVVWMVSTHPPNSSSRINPRLCTKNTNYNGITVTFMFLRSFNSLARSRYWSFLIFLNDTPWSAGTAKSIIRQVLSFFCGWLFLWLVVWLTLGGPIVSQNPRGVCVSHSPGQILGCANTICSYGQISIFLHNFQWITLLTQSCLVLYSFCANLLHLLTMWLIVSSLSSHNLHLLFCCVLSILAFMWLVLMALFCAAIKRDSVSLLRFPFLRKSMFSRVKYRMLVVWNVHWIVFLPSFFLLVIVVPLVFVSLVLFLVAVISLPSLFCI